LEGDVFDPSGTLTDGYQNMNASILTKYNECRRVENEYNERRHGDLKVHKLEVLDKKLKGNKYF